MMRFFEHDFFRWPLALLFFIRDELACCFYLELTNKIPVVERRFAETYRHKPLSSD